MALAAQSIDPHEAMRAAVRERLATIRRSKALWRADYPSFARDALIIQPKDPLTDAPGDPRPFILNSAQQKLHALIENEREETGMVRAIVLKARQLGISTYVSGRFYHRMKYDGIFRSLVMAHREDATENLYMMLQTYLENDPDRPETTINNAEQTVFANGSRIRLMVAGPVKTGTGRAFTFQLAHLSELAFWNQAAEHMNAVLRAVPRVPGSEIIIESTAQGSSGVFHSMAMAAQQGIGDYRLYFLPWYEHDEYAIEPPAGWKPGEIVRELAENYDLSPAQLFWAQTEATNMAVADQEALDELPWRFKQEYPSNINEAFRAGRKGGYIKSSVVAAARKRVNPHQPDQPLVFGCDFACGGGGQSGEYTDAAKLSGSASDAHTQDQEGGDSNVFISHRGRCKGRELYERFKDRDTVSVANKLQAAIERLKPARVFMDSGGGGAQVYDILCDRGYGRVLELVDFGGGSPDKTCRNMRSFMHKEFRDWLKDGDIPDDDLLETEITGPWVVREDESGMVLAPKREIRRRLKISPDGSDACITCHAAPVRTQGGSVGVGIGRGRR